MEKLKSDYRTFFINYWYKDEAYDYMDDNNIYWIGNWHILACSDIFVSLEQIEDILRFNIDMDIFYDWYWWSVEEEENRVNLENYSKIRWKGTHEDFLAFQIEQEKKRNDPEYKAQVEAELKKIWDDGMKNIENHLKSSTSSTL